MITKLSFANSVSECFSTYFIVVTMGTKSITNNNCLGIMRKSLIQHKEVLSFSLQSSIDNIIKNENFVTYATKVKKISTKGGNYLGTLYEVLIEGNTNESSKVLALFIKEIIPSDKLEFLSVNEAYKRELLFYNEISKMYNQMENESNIPLAKRFATCRSFNESNAEAIILENISYKGFDTLNRMEVVPLGFAELSVQQLGKFHALSFAMETKYAEYYQNKVKNLSYLVDLNDQWKIYLKKIMDNAISVLDDEAGGKLVKFHNKMSNEYLNLFTNNSSSRCCLCHGDYRANNILKNDLNGKITKIIPVDYQLVYFGTPVHDFMYFIFGATDKQFRDRHLDHLKKLYYDSMADYMEVLGLNPETVYSKNQFEKDYKERLDFGLLNMLMLAPFIFAPEDDVPDLGKQSLSEIEVTTDDRYKERVRGIVDEFIEWGYL